MGIRNKVWLRTRYKFWSGPGLLNEIQIGETCAAVLAGIGTAVSDIAKSEPVVARTLQSTCATQQQPLAPAHATAEQWRIQNDPARRAQRHATVTPGNQDGRWFLPHFGLPNLRARVLNVLGCDPNPESVAAAVANWNAIDLEAAIDEARACGAMVRSIAEWMAHPLGLALAAIPFVEIIKVADSQPVPFAAGEGRLWYQGIDLTHILAGPIAAHIGRTRGQSPVTTEGLPQIPHHDGYEPWQAELFSRSQE